MTFSDPQQKPQVNPLSPSRPRSRGIGGKLTGPLVVLCKIS